MKWVAAVLITLTVLACSRTNNRCAGYGSATEPVTAFSQTLHTPLKNRCAGCHNSGGSGGAYPFAQPDAAPAHEAAKNLLAAIEANAGTPAHCGQCNDGASMKAAIEAFRNLVGGSTGTSSKCPLPPGV